MDKNKIKLAIEHEELGHGLTIKVMQIDTDANYGRCIGVGVCAMKDAEELARCSFEFLKEELLTDKVVAISARNLTVAKGIRELQRREATAELQAQAAIPQAD